MKEHTRNSDNAQKEKEIADLARYLEENSLTIDEYLSEEEWNRFLEAKNASAASPDEETYGPVYKATLHKNRIRRNIRNGITLALVLAIGVSAWFVLDVNSYFTKPAAEAARIAFSHTNTSGLDERITLADGSEITLRNGSKVHYMTGYNNSHRNIYLDGSAVFSVAKNPNAPFTVYCRSIATTALGTLFRVDGSGENPSVYLYEGKVVVKGVEDTTVSSYLLPGDAVAYMESDHVFRSVADISAPPPVARTKTPSAARSSVPASAFKEEQASPVVETLDAAANRAYLNFQNKKLSTVFDYLADRYDVEIRYPTDIALSTNVLLSVDASQPIDRILENICRTSGLTANKLDDRTYTITK